MSAIDYSTLTNALNLAKKALEFYGDEKTYKSNDIYDVAGGAEPNYLILIDNGHQARYAIETINLILNPNPNEKQIRLYNEAMLEAQKINMKESIKNMTSIFDDIKQQYDTLLKSGKLLEDYPELEGNWESDEDEFIKKLYE